MNNCLGKELCLTCSWFNKNRGNCSGCDKEYHERCKKRFCYSSCDKCGGEKQSGVPGCCGHMPLSFKGKWDTLLETSLGWDAPEKIEITSHLLPAIHSIQKYDIPSAFPEIDAWVAPIHKVANRKGQFYSKDLKDYLGLSSSHKLILSTNAPDDYQEMLWNKVGEMNFKKHSIDYWFPAHFSCHTDDSKMNKLANEIRKAYHAYREKSSFVWLSIGKNIPPEFNETLRNYPFVLIGTGQMRSLKDYKALEAEVQMADQWFSKETSFVFVGGRRKLPVSKMRIHHEINSSWLIRGLKGYSVKRKRDKSMSKREILINNLKTVLYMNKCEV